VARTLLSAKGRGPQLVCALDQFLLSGPKSVEIFVKPPTTGDFF